MSFERAYSKYNLKEKDSFCNNLFLLFSEQNLCIENLNEKKAVEDGMKISLMQYKNESF